VVKGIRGAKSKMDWLYVLTGIAVMMATMTTIWFTVNRQDRIFDRMRDRFDDDNGGIRH